MLLNNYSGIRIFFAGDFCSKPSTSLITPSDELKKVLDSCDCRVVNFEVPLKPDIDLPERVSERFFQNDDAPKFLQDLGFNLFTIASNHTFDWGDEGYWKTKAALGDVAFGAGTFDEAYKVKIIELKGIKIGFLALSYAVYTWTLQDTEKREGLGCAYINDLKVNHVIIEAKKNVDYLFVLPHDGIEYIDAPMPETIARYRDFIDYGADGVFGTHPHCPQGWEVYKEKPIFYSLGNFFFNSKKDTLYRAYNRPHWYEGRCVILNIENGKITSEVINTCNVDNTSIEIDHTEDAISHNRYVCGLIFDKQSYNKYLTPIIKKKALNDMRVMEEYFQPHTVMQSVSVLKKCLIQRIKSGKSVSKNRSELLYVFQNDLRKARVLRLLLGKLE